MLIIRTRDRAANPGKVVSIFWSNGLLCQVLRGPEDMPWYAWIRLWDSHPWVQHGCRLERRARSWRWASTPRNGYVSRDPDTVSASVRWVTLCSFNPRVSIADNYVQRPYRYWQQSEQPKRNRKQHKLATVYMESLCCTLCSLMRDPP